MKSNRRFFLKKTGLTLFGLCVIQNKANAKLPLITSCDITTQDFYGTGPFYTANAPLLIENSLASEAENGERIEINGSVKSIDCLVPLSGVEIEMWHANSEGQYDNSGFNLRGKIVSDINGNFSFETILPGKYLNGNQFRPAHIHFKFTYPNMAPLVTQLYFEGDTSIAQDAAASIVSGEFDATNRILNLQTDADGKKIAFWPVVLDVNPTSINNIHLDKGLIYKVNPNPIKEKVSIQYGVFKEDQVLLQLIDSAGKIIETLVNSKQKPDKYNIIWQPKQDLTNGIYYLVLKMNSLQISHQRIIKE